MPLAPYTPEDLTRRQGVALAVGAAVLWSTSGFIINILNMPPLQVAGLRSLIAGLALTPFLRPAHLRLDWRILLILIGSSAIMYGTFVFAVHHSTTANAIALQSTAPAWVFGLTCLLDRKIPWRFTFPVGLVLAGIVVILLEPAHGSNVMGNAVGAFSGLGFGVYSVLVSRLPLPAFGLVSLANLGAGLSLLSLAYFSEEALALDARQWWLLLFFGVAQIAAPAALFAAALRKLPAPQAQMLALLEPLLNPLWVFLLLGEIPTGHGLGGGGLILLGILADLSLRRGSPSLAKSAPS